jgi:uncharacterized OB-fold protein
VSVNSVRAHFEEGCARGVLLYQWDAGRAVFPPRALPGLEWRESAGQGTVYAATVVRPRGGEPRSIVLVDLDEGFRMMMNVIGEDRFSAAIGRRVSVVFEPRSNDQKLPQAQLEAAP